MDKKTPLLHPGERGELEGLMKRFGVDARYDEMLNAPAIKGVPGVEGNELKDLVAYTKVICRNYKLSRTIVDEQLESIIESNVINPVRDWLTGITRTKTNNPVHELVDNLPVEDKEWVKVAMYRWLIQCCAAADMAKHEGKHPDAIPKYECVLVLGGDQGLHKTSFIKYLLPAELHKYIKDSVRLDTKDRDSMLNILRCWIPELADLDPALKKKGLPELKGFLAKEVDEIRLTYARKPTIIRRHVSCMTSVEGEYPPKGTRWDRRFLPVIAKGRLDYPRVYNFDYTDLWAFIWDAYTHGGSNGGLRQKKRLYVRKS
ncbi:putative DNA primase/helicase [Bathymodiolus platifrons methanotrophic gill symbiont]|uniref:VapE domain-containing protein n=1 Tax=Bathymodiolus platifrons methanotrophic gill symbiont TaxID=113268 RepID=UPI000B416D8F|nr:VapE domain-containing protein [Bathymodiolus platifrons methanotrophic gill symbiont]GAW87420.1 putative DNA primase/helicase [Bathymodiolus platifrons methanotrophic gill symbiont]